MNMQDEIVKTVGVLRQGGIILYPTDTIWGIGCIAFNEKAVKRIYTIKKKEDTSGMLILLDSKEKLNQFVKNIPETVWQLMENFDKPVTLIYPEGYNLATSLLAKDGSIGIRITSDIFCGELIKQSGAPLVSTSANISGQPPPSSFTEIASEIKNSVDYIVKWRQNENIKNKPSALVKFKKSGEFIILRK